MGISAQNVEPHWNYLLAIEGDLKELSRYVEFDEKNFGCFSIEIARILLACGAEVDVVCKQVCKAISQNSKARDIHTYRVELNQRYPNIPNFQVLMPRFGLTLVPWDEWSKAHGVPDWWTAYNKVKHERDSEYQRASLKNALNAVGGLFVILLHMLEAKGLLGNWLPSPLLLSVVPGNIAGRMMGGPDFGVKYRL